MSIADWHQGTRDEHGRMKLSSRQLLVVLEFLPDNGAFKMALAGREGDWPEDMQIWAAIHEQLAMDNAAKYGLQEAQVFLSPKARWKHFLEQAEEEQDADEAMDTIDGWFE